MTRSQSEHKQSVHKKESWPQPMWTKILPWVILISTSIVCFFVIQKGCVATSTNEDRTNINTTSTDPTYASQGIKDLEVALEHSKTEGIEFVLDGITFVQGSGLIEATSMPALEQLLKLMQQYQTMHIRLEGYCLMQQDPKANLRISHLRAAAVANYLKGKGIDTVRLRTVGRGKSRRRASQVSNQGIADDELVGLIVERR